MAMTDEDEGKRTIRRGPAYPAIGIARALEYIGMIHKKDQQLPTGPEIAVKHIGYASLHGVARRTLAALKAFGFLEETNGNVRVADLAMHIMFPHSDSEKGEALVAALKSPRIYADLITQYGDDIQSLTLPSDDTLKAYLIRSKNFNVGTVDAFIEVFRESLNFVKNQLMLAPPVGQPAEKVITHKEKTTPPDVESETRRQLYSGKRDEIPIRLPGGRRAILTIPAPFYEADKEHIIAQIRIIVPDEKEN
jgi:hypothetical protein